MTIELDFKGVDGLIKEMEKAASEIEIRAVNKAIIKKGQSRAQKIMSEKVPRSADNSKSGKGFGTKSNPGGHAADNVPVGGIRAQGVGAKAQVGWTKSYNGDHFYVKFINWGTIYQPPREFIHATGDEMDKELKSIAEKEYREFLRRTVK